MFYGTEILRETGFSNQIALMANIANGVKQAIFSTLINLPRCSLRAI